MVPRFFAPAAADTGTLAELPDDEAGHLVRVLRLRRGAAVRAFDGRGREWRAVVEDTAGRHVSLRLLEEVAPAREPAIRVVLAIALLKGDKMDDVVRDAVMLGVSAIRPLVSRRVEVLGPRAGEARRTRWQRIAVSSAKQCGRAVVPEVWPASTLAALLNEEGRQTRIALMEPQSATRARRIGEVPPSDAVDLIVGPEGGWDDAERERLAATCELVTLGDQTLRADAVALVAMTALRVAWKDF
jgi:16S rRNA (uracil1498-N3)-methyltransferase